MCRMLLQCLIIGCLIIAYFGAFGHGGPIRRIRLEDGSSLAIREADIINLLKNADPLSDYNSKDIDETDTEKVDLRKYLGHNRPRLNLRPP